MIPCMGGFCNSRHRCKNYYATGRDPVERLCGEEEEVDEIERLLRTERRVEGIKAILGRDNSLRSVEG